MCRPGLRPLLDANRGLFQTNLIWQLRDDAHRLRLIACVAQACGLGSTRTGGSNQSFENATKKRPVQSYRPFFIVAHSKGFEPLTPKFVAWCSIQLSYECVFCEGCALS